MKNPSVKRKIIITASGIWTVISLILSLCITEDNDKGYFLSNFLTLFISFLTLTIPVWLYWIAFWIWGDVMDKLIGNFFSISFITNLRRKITPSLRKVSYVVILLFSMLVAASLAHTTVKSFFENRKVIAGIKELSAIGATEVEIEDLIAKTRNHKISSGNLLEEKSFRSIILRNVVSQINKQSPTKIDELTYLIEAKTDGDRTLSYKYRVDVNDDEGKRIFDKSKDTMYWDRKKYWCQDERAVEFRKMKAIIIYEYFSKEKTLVGSYLIDIQKECEEDLLQYLPK
ncbi:MAG: hypothetical protein K0R25_1093 [Rickettsiaceae bacterium]|jgi:hypothetical protein|nr:hypothetical protein [Rickettsiaceae bacterium]